MVDPLIRPGVQRELRSTGRLPESVQWIEARADVSVLQQLQLIAAQAGSERLVIVDGSATYHPSLLQKAKEWNNESVGLALTSGDKPVGIYAFTEEAICDLKKSYPSASWHARGITRSTQGDAVCHSDSGCRGLVAARSVRKKTVSLPSENWIAGS